MNYAIKKEERPIYLQVYRRLRDDIVAGAFPYGGRLPSKRVLADEMGVSTVTAEHAYSLLCDEGYAEARERSGYFVIFRQADSFASSGEAAPTVRRKASAPSYPSFSVSVLSKTMRKVLAEYYDVILERSPNTGRRELRAAIQRYLLRNRAMQVELDQIVIGSGAEYLYSLIVELLGRDKTFAIEDPAYEKIEKIYRAAGVSCELLPLAEDGIESGALSASRADVLHTTPYQSYPSGVTASASKRHEYVNWAERGERFIVESDYGSEFSVSSQPTETLFKLSRSDNVIYLNTFSKTISSSMRVGYMVLPRKLIKAFEEKLGFYSCTVPTFEQFVLAELLNSGDFERHINRVRRKLRKELYNK